MSWILQKALGAFYNLRHLLKVSAVPYAKLNSHRVTLMYFLKLEIEINENA